MASVAGAGVPRFAFRECLALLRPHSTTNAIRGFTGRDCVVQAFLSDRAAGADFEGWGPIMLRFGEPPGQRGADATRSVPPGSHNPHHQSISRAVAALAWIKSTHFTVEYTQRGI